MAPHLTVSKFNKRRGRLLEEIRYVQSLGLFQNVQK